MPVNPEELSILKMVLAMVIFLVASVWDIRKRIVPNFLPTLLALIAFLPVSRVHVGGILVAVLLLVLGIFVGGIGGGDIKMIAAYGLVRGVLEVTIGVTIAMLLLILFHGLTGRIRKQREGKAYPLMPFLMIGCMAAGLICL